MRILVTGSGGFLGRHVVAEAIARGHETHGASRTAHPGPRHWHTLDVRDGGAVRAAFEQVAPAAVIHLAYRVDDWATTARGAMHVARACADAGAHLTLMSTDWVFTGGSGPIPETADPAPVTPYGAAKAAAELAATALCPSAAVARSSVIFGDGDGPFDRFVGQLAAGGEGVLFQDQFRCFGYVRDVAAALVEIAERRLSGPLHLVGPQHLSRLAAGRLLAGRLGWDADRLRGGPIPHGQPAGLRDLWLADAATRAMLEVQVRGPADLS